MDYEKLGAFYLGKTTHDTPELVLYDSKDLTTHAVIIGMTGSGKTGLGIGLLEEALVDNIPIIAIDPKGDLGNLLLSFPELTAENFEPWVNPQEASNAGQSVSDYAGAQAELWKQGLADWGQDEARIAKLCQSVDMNVYTPGSSAGLQVSLLSSFNAPPPKLREDSDLYREHLQSTTTSILALLGENDLNSREHSLISSILESSWSQNKNLDLAGLIHAIQKPPFDKIGVMSVEQFYPSKDRATLAMKLNTLLASPGFKAWLEGEPLNVGKLLHTDGGKARASIFSIAHLSDSERMFFVTMLLNTVLAWMRSQSGTSSLRAILYMDEVFGYLPPSANPPSKTPLLTLLKQARAFGLGLALSTQNPVDLDYKALSNAGTWFIGRLQTERDKARVLEGLEGASAGATFDKNEMERTLASLDKRQFLLHNINEDTPVVFQTRWVMSYLSGPMTREQIKRLMADKKAQLQKTDSPDPDVILSNKTVPSPQTSAVQASQDKPIMPEGVPVYYAPVSGDAANIIYYPSAAGFMEINYSSVTHKVNETPSLALGVELQDGPVTLDWDDATELGFSARELQDAPAESAAFADLPKAGLAAKAYGKWQKDLIKHIRQDRALKLFKNKEAKLTSKPGESERDFRARVSLSKRERRDEAVAKLRKKYADKVTRLDTRLQKAQQKIEKESSQVRQRQMDTALNVGTAVLSAVLGRKRLSVTSVNRVTRAAKSAARVSQDQMDVAKAKESAAALSEQLQALEAELAAELSKVEAEDPTALALEEVFVRANSADITLDLFALLWLPYTQDNKGRLVAAFEAG